MTVPIVSFSGPNHFLSNFYVEADGLTGEHRFQARKCITDADLAHVLGADGPAAAKAAGREVQLRPDWEQVKIDEMRSVVADKFTDPVLRDKLIATGNALLIEGNRWNDTFWGVRNPVTDVTKLNGTNWLGRILMETRDHIFNELLS